MKVFSELFRHCPVECIEFEFTQMVVLLRAFEYCAAKTDWVKLVVCRPDLHQHCTQSLFAGIHFQAKRFVKIGWHQDRSCCGRIYQAMIQLKCLFQKDDGF